MIIDETKLARQKEGIIKWINNNYIGIFDYATGVGKTFSSFLAIEAIKDIKNPILIVLPSAELVNQWKLKIDKHFSKKIQERIYIYSINEILEKNSIFEVGLLIIDEIHEFKTSERIKIINKTYVKYDKILGLTASADDKDFKIIKNIIPIIDIISEEEAKQNKWIADFVEYNLELNLNETEKEIYDKYTELINNHINKFGRFNPLDMANAVLSGGKDKNGKYWLGTQWAKAIANKNGWSEHLDLSNPLHNELNNLWHPNKVIYYARTLLMNIRERRNFLCNTEEKKKATIELLLKFDKVKTIVFSESTSFADIIFEKAIEKKVKATIYHSKLKTILKPSEKSGKLIKYGNLRQKKEAIEHIRKGTKNTIITAKSLDRGFDVEDIRLAITTSGSSNPTQYKQRGGRAKRKEKGIYSDFSVLLINLYIKDTQDEIWLNKRQSKATHDIYKINNINEIDYIPPSNILIEDI